MREEKDKKKKEAGARREKVLVRVTQEIDIRRAPGAWCPFDRPRKHARKKLK